MEIAYYQTSRGDRPVEEYILALPAREQAAVEAVLLLLAAHGFSAPGIICRHIEGKLWELKVGPHRILYIVMVGPEMVLLHAFKKQSRKTPKKELDLARTRMKEVLP
jgi:phage-related protein